MIREPGRYEYKYALPVSLRGRALELAGGHIGPDPHAGDLPGGLKGYRVHSLYFDTPDWRDYTDRLAERKVRNRLRVRTYGLPGGLSPVFLENKRKLMDRVVKHRVRICDSGEWLAAAAAGDHPWREFIPKVAGAGRYGARVFSELVDDHGRVPVTVVHYEREVFQGHKRDGSRIRLTFDHNVGSTTRPHPRDIYAPSDVMLLPPDWMVMELKFDGDRPPFMRHLAREMGLRAVPVSKFGLSVCYGYRMEYPVEVRYFTPRPLRHRLPIARDGGSAA